MEIAAGKVSEVARPGMKVDTSGARLLVGYPVITDPTHPLWAEAQAGWPTLAPHEAMTKAVEHMATGRANSRVHPAFGETAIVNAYATRPVDDAKAAVEEKERR